MSVADAPSSRRASTSSSRRVRPNERANAAHVWTDPLVWCCRRAGRDAPGAARVVAGGERHVRPGEQGNAYGNEEGRSACRREVFGERHGGDFSQASRQVPGCFGGSQKPKGGDCVAQGYLAQKSYGEYGEQRVGAAGQGRGGQVGAQWEDFTTEGGVSMTLPCDAVVEALDMLPSAEVFGEVAGAEVVAVGDCADPWNIEWAITSGNLAGRGI